MPLVQAKAKVTEFIKKYQSKVGSCELIDVIDELALFFVVSRQAAKIRMTDLGYEEAIGAFTYIDGRYVKPHKFKKGTIKRNQTFSISHQDALIQSAISLELRNSIQSGNYTFVDSHFCINNPKYIEKQADGEVILTNYARLHMDECCLVFDLKILSADSYGEKYYTECVLYRDAKSGITFEAQYSSSGNNSAVISRAVELRAFLDNTSDIMAKLPSDFAGMYIINCHNMGGEIATQIGISLTP